MNQTSSCLLCSGRAFRLIHRKGKWQYQRCLECGLVRLFPRPSDVETIRVYDDYLPQTPGAVADWHGMMLPVVQKAADLIAQRVGARRGRVLDIGCGYGFFLHEMAQRGWQTEGIEISATGRKHARDQFNLKVRGKPLEKLQWPAGSFDAVTLFYVIEHLVDPHTTLERIRHWLKPGGLLLLRWPHTTPVVRLLGPLASRLDLYHTPYHLYDFSPATMAYLLSQSAFERIETRIGGYTLPARKAVRWCTRLFGALGQGLYRISQGRVLMPGLSKTTIAFKSLSKS